MMNLKSSKEEVSNPSELKVVEAEVVMESPEVLKVKSRPVKKVDVRKMAIIGVLAAISIMLSMTPLGFIPIGPTNATIMHIPVIIGAIVEGPLVGITVGFIFGATSLLKALTMPTITSFAFINPLVSILPRMLIGVIAYYVYKLTIKFTKNVFVSGWITGVVGSLVNTVGVLGMIYILYGARYAEALGESASAAKTLILTLGATSGIPEAIVGVLAACIGIWGAVKLHNGLKQHIKLSMNKAAGDVGYPSINSSGLYFSNSPVSVIPEKSGRRIAERGISFSSLTLSPVKRDK